MSEKTRKPRAKKIKVPKAPKPKKISILDTDLLPLKEADELLKRIEAQSAEVKQKEIEFETADDARKAAKGALDHARNELQKLCDARKEQHPLFQQPPVTDAKEKTQEQSHQETVSLLPEVVISSGAEHGIPIGTAVRIDQVKRGGLLVSAEGHAATPILDEEYTASPEVSALIGDARAADVVFNSEAWLTFVQQRLAPFPSTNPQVKDGWKGLPLEAAKINGRGGKLLTEAGYETLGAVAKLMRDHGQWWNKEVKGIGEETAAEIADRFAEFWVAHPEFCGEAAA